MGRMMKLAMAGLAVVGAYKLATGGRRRGEQRWSEQARRGDDEDAIAEREPSRQDWDDVDEASYESFPASDPPPHSRDKL
jgi:hypothetical protein